MESEETKEGETQELEKLYDDMRRQGLAAEYSTVYEYILIDDGYGTLVGV